MAHVWQIAAVVGLGTCYKLTVMAWWQGHVMVLNMARAQRAGHVNTIWRHNETQSQSDVMKTSVAVRQRKCSLVPEGEGLILGAFGLS